MVIQNRFKELLAQKERREGRRISYQEIKEVTGVDTSTLSRWATNQVAGADFNTLDKLCEYLECGVGELLVRDDDAKQFERQEFLAANL